MPIKKKKYNARFPPARIKKIMQTDEDVGKVAAAVPVIISRALELFVENLLKKANEVTTERGARTLTPSHLKMCIKSESRFDFLKELVSSVPDLQGDHDDLQPSMTGLDLSIPFPKTSTTQAKITSNNSSLSQRLLKLPRQLSTPRPRGRPRTVSADLESKIPKKRRKPKRQPKFVDDTNDISNGSADDLDDDEVLPASKDYKSKDAVVTCTVTTHINNGFKNGIGFTLSIPSTSLTSGPLSTLTSPSSSPSKNGLVIVEEESDHFDSKKQPTLALVAHDQKGVHDVDEDYDDC